MNMDAIKFEEMPAVMAQLVKEIRCLKEKIDEISSSSGCSVKIGPGSKRRIMRTSDVCFLLGKTPVTIYRMVKRGELTAYKNGKELFFFEDEVLAMLEDGKMTVTCACRNA